MKIKLVLENGKEFIGKHIGARSDMSGEVVFTTSMVGYQESLTDPSYYKQILVFTYPLIGNYGINEFDFESSKTWISGVVVSSSCTYPNHCELRSSFDDYLKKQNIAGISQVDTRSLTREIRNHGSMRGIVCDILENNEQVIAKLKSTDQTIDTKEVATNKIYKISGSKEEHVVIIDYGMKMSILTELLNRGCTVSVVPHDISYEQIISLNPDGVLLSNGPGNPSDMDDNIIFTIKKLISSKIPMFGICLGHQLFALANNSTAYKLKFGHRGVNHPVKDLATGRIYITSQNHSYAVSEDKLDRDKLVVTHIALNDGTVEGISHVSVPAFSVQYHPESKPGPHDTCNLFDKFIDMIKRRKTNA